MKIKFTNLGSIKSGEIELKPLTICIGPNNTGKTYSAYCIYGILDPAVVPLDLNVFDEFIDELTERGYIEIDLEKIIINHANLILNDLCKIFVEKAIYKFMQTSKKGLFDNTKIEVELSEEDLNFMFKHLMNSEIKGGIGVTKDKELIVTEKKKNEKILRVYTRVENEKDREAINQIFSDKKILRAMLIANVLSVILGGIRKDVAVLPAERLALVTLYRYLGKKRSKTIKIISEAVISEEDFEDAEKLRDLIRNIMFVSYKYPKPIKDFIEFLDNLDEISEKFENDKKLKETRKDFIQLSELIENEILGGKIVLEKKEEITQPILEFELEDGKRLDLHITSTAVKELTGLVLYFRYLIEKNDYLIIDEPEMNLHPEAQVKLLEIITMAVNKGVNVILTTHSPYIVDHLMNLMEGYDVKDKIEDKSLPDYLFLGYKESFISPEKIGVYFFTEDGKIVDIFNAEERIIDWETFSNVSDMIGVIYNRILELRRSSDFKTDSRDEYAS